GGQQPRQRGCGSADRAAGPAHGRRQSLPLLGARDDGAACPAQGRHGAGARDLHAALRRSQCAARRARARHGAARDLAGLIAMPRLGRVPPPLLTSLLLLAACDTFLGEPEAPPLPGKRVSVLKLDSALDADPELAELQVKLPKPYANPEWPQSG